MAETDERSRVARVPAPRAPFDGEPAAAAAEPAVVAEPAEPVAATEPTKPAEPAEAAEAAAAAKRSRRLPGMRRVPQPPGRRAPLWLGALMAGALLAAAPGLLGDAGPRPIDASDYGLGIADSALGDLEDAGARRGITEAEARLRLSELAASRAAREPKTVIPVSEYRLTTCFCMRWGQFHPGWDMAAPLGTPIYSAVDGVVLDAGPAPGFGYAVYIQDEDGNVHIYGHMRYYSVEAGQIVRAGDEIATIGNEGFSTGPHLHWEIHEGGRDGEALDPEAWLAERDVAH